MLLRRHYVKPVKEEKVVKNDPLESPKSDLKEVSDTIGYDDITKKDIISELEDLEIEHNKRDTKKELFELLNESKGW